ncbi:protein of unknown function DUF1367 [Vibrio phage 1.013.O._10N.286.54.F9]|nr:protein of unknown function DUF1367 [Vibrio phage 1.013.O._10N.286.54.F9]
MKVSVIKQHGGVLIPANESEAERMKRFKTGEGYEVEIKQIRNYKFHQKVFAFLNFCFEYHVSRLDCAVHERQFEVFRDELTVNAGYYDEFWTMKGTLRIEAKSISYANMSQEDFEHYYNSLINAAIKLVFNNTKDQSIINQLYAFF